MLWQTGQAAPLKHEALQIVLTFGKGCRLVSWLYKSVLLQTQTDLMQLQRGWETAINRDLHNKEWTRMLERVHTSSHNTRFCYTQLNFLHMSYLTPHRFNMIQGTADKVCLRCNKLDIHMTWSCMGITQYWQEGTVDLEHTLDWADVTTSFRTISRFENNRHGN